MPIMNFHRVFETCLTLIYLQLVTHERDMLKKDVKKITMERDGALKHLSLTTGKKFPAKKYPDNLLH